MLYVELVSKQLGLNRAIAGGTYAYVPQYQYLQGHVSLCLNSNREKSFSQLIFFDKFNRLINCMSCEKKSSHGI